MPSTERLHYLDNLRALAMLAGVLFHAALAYSPLAHPLFPTADRQSSVLVDVLVWFPHLFRMPLFFLVAGFFTALLVQRRGLGGMFRNRLFRVALPFVLFWPLIHQCLAVTTLHAAATAEHPSPLLALIRQFQQQDGLPPLPPGTSHLWFLYYLMYFYVLVWAARVFGIEQWAARIARMRPALLLAGMPLAIALPLATVSAPHPAPESLLPQFWALGYFGFFFALGYGLHGQTELIDAWRPHARTLLLAGIACYAVWLPLVLTQIDGEFLVGPIQLLQACLAAAISVWMTLACLCFGRSLLNRSSRLLGYLSETSYWVYLVHLPILFAVQYRLMDADLHWILKFAVAVMATLGLALLGYEALVRRFAPLARMLGSSRSVVAGGATSQIAPTIGNI
ncbi:MAG: acyltransferase family protein [Lysobacterales bacterium]